MSRRTAASLVLGALIVLFLGVFFGSPTFFDWVFTRHQNTLSWVARPLLLIPLCLAAWMRHGPALLLAILALLTSMAWFPAPEAPRDDVVRFLAMERGFLTGGWTLPTVLGALAVLAYGVALIIAFWRRSWRLGLIVAALGALLKALWSLLASPEGGAAVLPYALGGFLALALAVGMVLWITRKRAGKRTPPGP